MRDDKLPNWKVRKNQTSWCEKQTIGGMDRNKRDF